MPSITKPTTAASTTSEATTTQTTPTTKASKHSPCTEAGARCRLAAIAAIAEVDAPFVARAWAAQAEAEAKAAEAAAADDTKDKRTVKVAWRWVKAANAAVGQ